MYNTCVYVCVLLTEIHSSRPGLISGLKGILFDKMLQLMLKQNVLPLEQSHNCRSASNIWSLGIIWNTYYIKYMYDQLTELTKCNNIQHCKYMYDQLTELTQCNNIQHCKYMYDQLTGSHNVIIYNIVNTCMTSWPSSHNVIIFNIVNTCMTSWPAHTM